MHLFSRHLDNKAVLATLGMRLIQPVWHWFQHLHQAGLIVPMLYIAPILEESVFLQVSQVPFAYLDEYRVIHVRYRHQVEWFLADVNNLAMLDLAIH